MSAQKKKPAWKRSRIWKTMRRGKIALQGFLHHYLGEHTDGIDHTGTFFIGKSGQLRIATLGDWNYYYSYFLSGTMEGAIQNGAWFRPIPLFGQSLGEIESQIKYFKPYILFCHCIFNKEPHDPEDLFAMLRRIKQSGVMVVYHAGDARTEPRYAEDISDFVSVALLNHGMRDHFSSIWKIPVYHWPYGALYQAGIVEPNPLYKSKIAFSGTLAQATGHVHLERTLFIQALKKKIDVHVFPDEKTGNTTCQTAELAASADCVLDVQMREDIPLYLSVRPFQYIGAGALFFHDDNDHINAFFEEGKHYVGYRKQDVDSLLEKYHYYVLQHPEKGAAIRRNGFEFCQKHHSWKERVKFVIDLYHGRTPKLHYRKNQIRTFEYAEIKGDKIEIDGQTHRLIKGKHAMYIPDKNMKIIWSYNGKIESYADWDKGRNAEALRNQTFGPESEGWDEDSLKSIVNEYKIFEELAQIHMGPPVDGLFYIKNLISDYIYGSRHCDPKGCYGFFIQNARSLKVQGTFTPEAFRTQFVDTGKIEMSPGAYGDVKKPENCIYGYLVDVRRTWHDMMIWKNNPEAEEQLKNIRLVQDEETLRRKIEVTARYPKDKNALNYQSYRLGARHVEGERNTLERLKQIGFPENLEGKTVLDLGCNLGAFCLEAYARGARHVTGIDLDTSYIECARDLARVNGFQINFLQADLTDASQAVSFIRSYYRKPVDFLLLLSVYEQLKGSIWEILEKIEWKTCYFESNHAPDGLKSTHVKEILEKLKTFSKINAEYLGQSTDSLPRCLWKLTRTEAKIPSGAL